MTDQLLQLVASWRYLEREMFPLFVLNIIMQIILQFFFWASTEVESKMELEICFSKTISWPLLLIWWLYVCWLCVDRSPKKRHKLIKEWLLTIKKWANFQCVIMCLVLLTVCQVKSSRKSKDFDPSIDFAHFRSSNIVI